jgi:parallel beta-helix repeat protein
MWKKIGFLSIVIFFIFLNPSFAGAEEIRVTDEETLITALEEASDGDVIMLEEGEYHGNFVIENSIEFKGEDGAHIKGLDTGYPLIIDADDVIVENLHVEGGGTDAAGIFSQGDRNQITNNTINNVFHGILVRDGQSNILTENKISSWDDSDRSYGYAMYVINGDGVMVSHNETYDTQDGVWVSHSTSAIINYNRFINARYGIHTMYADNVAIAHNEVRGSHNGGMIMESNNITITNNYFHLNTTSDGAGIFGYDLFDSVITDNIILGNARGIFLSYAQGNEIYRNDITENVRGVEFGDGGTNNKVYYNNFTKNTQQVVTNPENENEFNYAELGNFWDDQNILDLDGDGKNDFAYKSGDVFYQMIERDPFLQIFFDSPTVRLWNTIEQYTHIPSDTHVMDEYSLAEPVDIVPQVEVYVPEGDQMGFSNPAILIGLFVTIIAISGFTIYITRRREI